MHPCFSDHYHFIFGGDLTTQKYVYTHKQTHTHTHMCVRFEYWENGFIENLIELSVAALESDPRIRDLYPGNRDNVCPKGS